MNGRGRQFFRGGVRGQEPPRRRRYNNDYINNNNYDDQGPLPPPQQQHQQPPPQHHSQHHHNQQQLQQQQQQPTYREHNNPNRKVEELARLLRDQKTDIDELRGLLSKLNTELDQVKTRLVEVESSGIKLYQDTKEGGDHMQDDKDKKRKMKLLKQREKKALKLAQKRAEISSDKASQQGQQKILNSGEEQQPAVLDAPVESTSHNNAEHVDDQMSAPINNGNSNNNKYNRRTNRERNYDPRKARREFKEKPVKPLPKVDRSATAVNDDSTTQAAEPSSEERPEGDDGRDGYNKERVKVFRRKKQHFGRRGAYGGRHRRGDSSERHSNDTSPQGEANGKDDYQEKRKKNVKKNYPDLSEIELSEIVQTLKREFTNLERPLKAIKGTMNVKGPKVVYEFALSILDHAICDVTSPTKLSEIANSLYQLLVSEDNDYEVDFKQGFYDALNDISKREDDIAIDAPRYMDTLGQLIADCLVPMYNRQKGLLKEFLNRCIESYCPQNRAVLLASIMKSMASIKSECSAKEIWDAANMDWATVLNEGTDLPEFLESHEVTFTTQAFSPEPKATSKKTPKELEKFADDVTSMVERHCTPQALEDLVRELNLEAEDQLDYSGTLVYAIVRGCLITDSSGDIKLNNEALNKYSTLMNGKNEVSTKTKDAVALHALGALTKLWHQYNCPQDLFRTILVSLHSQGVASYGVLTTWLNSESMNNIPGIGAARLNSKRYIEDLGATIKSGAGM